jgi:eukaryotic-like serine/threonine-protein kinase
MPEKQLKKCLRCENINQFEDLNCSRCGRPLFGPYVQFVTGSEDTDNTTIPLPGSKPTIDLGQLSDPIPGVMPPSLPPAQETNSATPDTQEPGTPSLLINSNSSTTPLPVGGPDSLTTAPLPAGDPVSFTPAPIDNPQGPTPPQPRVAELGGFTLPPKDRWLLIIPTILVVLVLVLFFPLHVILFPGPTPKPTATLTSLPSLSGIETKPFPNGEYVGVNDGKYQPFDMGPQRADSSLKQQASQSLRSNDAQTAMTQWDQCLAIDTNDAEAKIYRENLNTSEYPHVTLLVGLDFPSPSQLSSDPDAIMATRSALQGAYIAQEEFNAQHKNIRMRLLLVNTGDDKNYIPLVAQQIASIVKQDKTVVGILGWQTSATTMNIASDLYNDGVNIPIVSQTATYDTLNQASPHLFQIAPLNQVQAGVALTLTKMLHKTQAIVFMDHHTDLASQNLGADFEKDFTQDFPNSKPIEEDFTVEHTNTENFYNDLKAALKQVQHPDQLVVFFAGTTNYDTGQFQDALAKLNNYPSFPVIAGDAGYVAHPASYNRWYVLAYAFHDEYRTLMGNDSPFFQEYSAAFNANPQHNGWYGYDIPNASAIMAYDAASILSHSIDQAHSGSNSQITLQEIEYQLGQIIWPGVSGQITLYPDSDPNDRALIVLKVETDKSDPLHGHFHMYCIHGTFSKNANNSLQQC